MIVQSGQEFWDMASGRTARIGQPGQVSLTGQPGQVSLIGQPGQVSLTGQPGQVSLTGQHGWDRGKDGQDMTTRTDCGHRRAGEKRVRAGGWDMITGKNSRIGQSIKTSGTGKPRYVSLYRSAWRTERTGRSRSDIKDRTVATGVL
jgi:hypothetical protein